VKHAIVTVIKKVNKKPWDFCWCPRLESIACVSCSHVRNCLCGFLLKMGTLIPWTSGVSTRKA